MEDLFEGLEVVDEVPQPTVPPATEKQVAFITRLKQERDTSQHLLREPTTKAQASELIELLLSLPKAVNPNEAPEGMHRLDGVLYKVQVAHHGSGNKYAKVFHEYPDWTLEKYGKKKGYFDYTPGAVNKLSPATLMSLEDAKEFGHLYGFCCRCGAILTDETSIEAGIGPICATKGWG